MSPVVSQGKVSRLGKEARAARHNPKGSLSRPTSAPVESEAGSGAESDSEDNEEKQASDEKKTERISGRRTRQASAQLESVWEELEATPPRHKSKRKASRSQSVLHTHQQRLLIMSNVYCELIHWP